MASLILQDGLFSLQFYSVSRHPQRKRVPLRVRVKRDAIQVSRKLERYYALGCFDPWPDDPLSYDRILAKPERLQLAVTAFLEAKAYKSARTLGEYRKVLMRLVESLRADIFVSQITVFDLEDWLDSTNAGDVTRHTYTRSLKVFFRWARGEGLTTSVATNNIGSHRRHPTAKNPPQVSELSNASRR